MIFAIEEINNSSQLLPNISIGYKVHDTCGLPLPSTRAVMGLMNGGKRTFNETCSTRSSVHAIIGASESSSTIGILQISGIFHIPVVNHCAGLICSSNFALIFKGSNVVQEIYREQMKVQVGC